MPRLQDDTCTVVVAETLRKLGEILVRDNNIFISTWAGKLEIPPPDIRRREEGSRPGFDQRESSSGKQRSYQTTILARRRQTLKSGEPRSLDPGVSTGMPHTPFFRQKHHFYATI